MSFTNLLIVMLIGRADLYSLITVLRNYYSDVWVCGRICQYNPGKMFRKTKKFGSKFHSTSADKTIKNLTRCPKKTLQRFNLIFLSLWLVKRQKLVVFWKAEIIRIQKMDVKIDQVIAEKIKVKILCGVFFGTPCT